MLFNYFVSISDYNEYLKFYRFNDFKKEKKSFRSGG